MLLIAACIWFIVYFCTASGISPILLFFGWFLLVPFTALRMTVVLVVATCWIAGVCLARKQFYLARICGLVGARIASMWLSLLKMAAMNPNAMARLYLGHAEAVATSCLLLGRFDEGIAVRQQMLQVAAECKFNCLAAKTCDSMAHLFRKKKDLVHARHFTQLAVEYYALAGTSCNCTQPATSHARLDAKQAALLAWLAEDSQAQGFAEAAARRARQAEELIEHCKDNECEIALIRLMDYFFKAADWTKFEVVAHRYLNIKHAESDQVSCFHEGNAWERLGKHYCETHKYDKAETALVKAVQLAKRSQRPKLLARAEASLAELRQRQTAAQSAES